MIYDTAQSWRDAPEKRVALFGMSGLGKTHVSTLLRDQGGWFHYSVDYRIGTHYMGEHIEDAFKAEAMGVPYLADLLRSDSIKIRSNIRFDNLAPLSTFLGKPGNPDKGGLPFAEYLRRQNLHREAEANALIDTGHFIDRAKRIYGYGNFICDTSGSICEVVDPKDPTDPVLSELSSKVLLVWIRGSDAHTDELARRFEKAPKPMYYNPRFLMAAWEDFRGSKEDAEVDPNAFVRWAYRRALDHRQPVYVDMAENWGVSVDAEDVAGIRSTADFEALIASALETRG